MKNNFEFKEMEKMDEESFDPLTAEEKLQEQENAKEWELQYQQYSSLAIAYERVILLEDDPQRKKILRSLCEDLHEDNK